MGAGAEQALAGRVALVTGSTRGIGRAIAERFAGEGARVVVNGRNRADVELAADQLPGEALGVAADVSDSAQAGALVERAAGRWGRLDVVVNNAGISRDRFVTRISDEDWQAVIGTNLSGAFYVLRACVPVMKDQGSGSIINVVSWAGIRGNVGQAGYAASKAGLYGLTLSLAKELAKFEIRVNALSPAAPTGMNAQMTESMAAKALARKPLGRPGRLEEIAEAALFLASERSSYTTGQILHADGGMHLL
ncbi:MAG: 3-oxoacyl-ACP reductase FabG [Proteobacteria bacterium]|nr:3-oxoacyl-ACP reductase FabG [Pseudomonadota bacterium]